jgi:hypothetical protein
MKKQFKQQVVFCLLAIFLFSSCAKIYFSPDAQTRAREHKIIAIVPPVVAIAAAKKVDAAALKEQQKTESTNFQKEIYSWLLKRKTQRRISVDIQDLETTIAKLTEIGYYEKPMTPNQVAEALGVDAVLTSNFALSKPMSEVGALASAVFFGIGGPTNQATISLTLHDKQTKHMIWDYNHKYSGGLFSSPASLVDGLMRHASKNMPYSKL